MFKLFFLVLIAPSVFALSLTSVSGDYKYEDAPEYQVILGQIKSLGEFSQMTLPVPVQPYLSLPSEPWAPTA